MVEAVGCPRCHRPVPADAPFGECPACLLLLGLADTPDGGREGTVAVTVADAPAEASGTATTDPDATLTAGHEPTAPDPEWPDVPGYRIVGELGAGGGGTVYLAEQLAAGRRRVAVKVLHGTSRQERERMAREMAVLGQVTHPNVVTLFETSVAACGPYFTMEYLPDGSLADRIQKARPSPAETARIVEQVARAVQSAHDRGILHRDLKPSNVLLAADGTAKVADFGLAKVFAGDDSPDRLTMTDHLLGTPSYMAPEQAGGKHAVVNERTDVYGLGGILYHCLTGRPPFLGATREETLRRVLEDDLVLPRSLVPRIPPVLEAICVKCLEPDAARRYPSARHVASELQRSANGQATEVRPLNRAARWRRAVARHRRVLWRLALAMLLAAVSIAGAVLLTRPEDPMARARRDLERRLRGTDPVVLIAEAGTPAWYRWESGATVFAESEFHDGACSVQSVIDSRLELVPAELVPPEFVFEADVRHDLFPDALSESGVYCLRGEWESTAEYRALSWLDVSFNDFPPPEDAVIKPDPPALRARAQTSLERAGQLDASGRNSIAMLYIEPAVARPHPWRYIRVKVTALGMEFQSERNGRPVPFGPLLVPARHLDEVSRSLATQLFPVRAGQPGANCPCWTRPGSLGLYVRSGKASFRNVVLTPIRGP